MSGKNFWKPGEAKPADSREGDNKSRASKKEDLPRSSGSSSSVSHEDGHVEDKARKHHKRKASSSKDMKGRYSSKKERQKVARQDSEDTAASKSHTEVGGTSKMSKTALSGPSQGLLAMKVMISLSPRILCVDM